MSMHADLVDEVRQGMNTIDSQLQVRRYLLVLAVRLLVSFRLETHPAFTVAGTRIAGRGSGHRTG